MHCHPLRLVLDTNVYISAALRGGRAEAILHLAVTGRVVLIASPAILNELADKMREKFGWEESQIHLLLETIRDITEVVEPEERLNVISDEPDNRILECAVVGDADLIVSDDRHLLRLKQYGMIGIISPQQLLYYGLHASGD